LPKFFHYATPLKVINYFNYYVLFGTWDNASNYLSFLKNKKEEAHNEASPVNQRKSLHVRIHADLAITRE
jgi:hypothetical protein